MGTRHIKVEKGINGTSSTGISAELYHGLDASVPSYEVIQLVKRSLNSIVSQSATIALLSSRIQKEQWGYSLRSSIACFQIMPKTRCAGICLRRDTALGIAHADGIMHKMLILENWR